MTSLPITVPDGYSLVVKKGDAVTRGDVLAVKDSNESETTLPSPGFQEQAITLSEIFTTSPDKVRKYLRKNPGDFLATGDIIAQRSRLAGLKVDKVIAGVDGTFVRFERDSGKVILSTKAAEVMSSEDENEIISPLDGTIAVCNNGALVIESDSDALVGTKGFGGQASGDLHILHIEEGEETILATAISKSCIDTILLVPTISREAVVKASAIGVAGIITSEISQRDLIFLRQRNITLPVVEVSQDIAKKLHKAEGKTVVINGDDNTVTIN